MVTVSVGKHPIFTRQGQSVYCEMPISFTQAALGAELEVPTLDGKVRYTIGEGTQTGTTFRLKGKGIYYIGSKNRGDQFVTVVVETPTHLGKEQRELLKKLEEASDSSQPKRKKFFEKFRRCCKNPYSRQDVGCTGFDCAGAAISRPQRGCFLQ